MPEIMHGTPIIHICRPEFYDVPLKVKSRTYLMDWHDYLGPKFYHRNGAPYFPGKHAPIWKAYAKWAKRHGK